MPPLSRSSRSPSFVRNLAFILSLAGFASTTSHAQTPPNSTPGSPTVSVSPIVAVTGTARTISITGTWPDGCVPGNASLVSAPLPGINTLTIRLVIPQSLTACTQAVTPYSATLTYTPTSAGVQRIAVMLSDGRFLGRGEIITQTTNAPRAGIDLTGVWFDPTTNGSGLSLFHAQDDSDVLAGTWYLYATNSVTPTWFLIQNTRWQSSTGLTGDLVIYTADAFTCPSASSQIAFGCPRPSANSSIVARFVIEVQSTDNLKAYAIPVDAPMGSLSSAIFTSNLTRLRF